MRNVTGNETLAAPTCEESPISLYPHVPIVNNPIPLSSNLAESQRNDPNVFHSSGNAPVNSIVSTHGKTPSTSTNVLNYSLKRNAASTSNNGNAPKSNGNAPLPSPYFSCKRTKNSKT